MSKAKSEDVTPEKDETPEGPILDLSDAAVKKMIKAAKARGFVTHEEILTLDQFNAHLLS